MGRKFFRRPTLDGVKLPLPGGEGGGGGGGEGATSATDDRWGSDTTWNSQGEREWGEFWDGSVYLIVPDAETEVLVSTNPAWTGEFHGSEFNPTPYRSSWAFNDGPISDYDHPSVQPPCADWNTKHVMPFFATTKQCVFPKTVQAWDVILTARAWDICDARMEAWRNNYNRIVASPKVYRWSGRSANRTIKPLFVIPAAPPANALPPSMWSGGSRLFKNGGTEYYTVDDVRVDLLPKFTKPAGVPTPENILPMAQELQIQAIGDGPPTANFNGNAENFIQGAEQSPPYGGRIVTTISQVLLWLCLDYPDSVKKPIAAWMARRGIDVYDTPGRATAWEGTPGGALMQGQLALCTFAGFLLQNAAMQNFYGNISAGTNKDRCCHEICQTLYISSGQVSLWNSQSLRKIVIGGTVVAGKPYWCPKKSPVVGNIFGSNNGYQVTWTTRHWVGFALAMMLCGIEDSIGHPALFDYLDWWMATQPERASDAWINNAWDLLRPQCARPIFTAY